MMLTWTIYISLLGGVAQMCLGNKRPEAARCCALLLALLGMMAATIGVFRYSGNGEFQTLVEWEWIPQAGINYHLAADGISCVMVLLTSIAGVAGVLFSWNIRKRAGQFFGFYFLLLAGVYGVFLSADLFLLFVFYEIAIVPKYFLIAIWGSTNREYGAMKLALYSFVGSGLVLIGILGAYVASGANTFSLQELAGLNIRTQVQFWLFPLTFIGFAILAGLWPFHTWAPTGHVAAPTAGSMLLAGVVMKLGAYGALRVSMVLFPEGLLEWQTTIAVLATIGIVYGAGVALTQFDLKYVIGYSSVSHMGFVLLGLASATLTGMSGAVLQMFSHGIIAGLLFAVVGRMVYERTHTRDLEQLEELNLMATMPFAAMTFLLASLASMGIPGFSGFVAELTILIGTWERYPILAIFSGVGIVVGIAFSMRALVRGFYGAAAKPTRVFERITIPEKIGSAVLLVCTIFIGVYPRALFQLIDPSLQNSLMKRIIITGP